MNTCPILECKISSINKAIKCQYCEFYSCNKCFDIFMKEKETPQCMSCNKAWTEEYIDETFSKSFKKNLQEKQKIVEFERERSMMPETMTLLEKKKKEEKLKHKIFLLRNEISDLEKEIRDLYRVQHVIKYEEKKVKVNIIKQCPNKKCNGYLNNDYVCALCDTKLCLDCEKIKIDDEHECKKEDVDTVLLKKKECKYCPTCSFETFKDGGCYLVWCPPPCNGGKGTAWNFNTGQIEKGPIHTPLYYEYMRKNGNNNLVNNCVNRNYLPAIWHIENNTNDKVKFLFEIHRKINELRYVYMHQYRPKDNNNIQDFNENLDLRLKFLKGEIDEKNFKKNLLLRKNKDKKNRKIHENLEMLYNVCFDIFEKLSFTTDANTYIDSSVNELEAVRHYYNQSIEKTKKILGCKSLNVSNLNRSWNFTH